MARIATSKAASIKDVAILAKVSVPTVSRYLNDREHVSAEKCERIAKAIELLAYRPNPIARALVRERTRSIAVLSTNTALFGQSQTIQGIETSARHLGYSLTISVLTDSSRKALEHSVQVCLDQNPAGVVLLNFDKIGNETVNYLPPTLPMVTIAGNRDKEIAQISLDESESGYAITRHLIDLGHRRIFHVAIPGGGGGYTRLNGWQQACEDAGIPVLSPIEAEWDPESGREIGRKLGKDPQITAIFAGNDEIAMGIIRGLGDVGKHVPEDVSVVGFDDHPISKVWNPGITTIRQNFNGAGIQAVEILNDKINDIIEGRGHTENWTKYIELKGELIIRESTAKPKS
ncbi:LacI family DNA-binding transcriptional regulator [Bifidobacterium aquikefiri]|uniref:LacI family DNA-binding transcriptional regulator n=1 Tax=Bifidobacterium aquikefiri TaxID=1653207 RepID=UPI0039ED7F0A